MICVHCGRETDSLVSDGEGGTVPICERCLARGPTARNEDGYEPSDETRAPGEEALTQESTGGDFVGCPRCKVFFGQLDDVGQLTVVCVRCRYRYYFLRGTLVETPVRHVVNRFFSVLNRSEHTLVLATPTGGKVALPHNPYSRRLAAWLSTQMRQPVTVVYTVRRDQFEELVVVRALATGDDFLATRPGRRSVARALRWAFVAFSATALFALAATNALVAVGIALVTSWAAFSIVIRRADPRQQLSTSEIAQFEHDQELVRKKVSLARLRDSAADEVTKKVAQARSWAALSRRMARVDQEAYSVRIQSLDRACRLLEEQASVHRRLVSLYDRAIAMTDIEMESSRLEELGPASLVDIESSVNDLKEELLELERQLTANTEVDRFLNDPKLGL